jgi:2-polyprenyl-3-methyl-5-hydroxy-6-metoxy-1,4-benzoquinol methylase
MRSPNKVYEITPEEVKRDLERGDWKRSGPHFQTLTFYNAMLNQLKASRYWPVFAGWSELQRYEQDGEAGYGCPSATIHDWGCGFGSGTALLQATFPTSAVVGYDYSPDVIEMARDYWPVIDFLVGDIREAGDKADIIFTSHTIEHMQDPVAIIERLRGLCCWLVVVVPVITAEKDGGHPDAVPTEEWYKLISPPPLATTMYTTVRKNRTDHPLMPESNILMFMQGKR